MPATYEKIATTTLGSAASSITFNSISSAYTDLKLVVVPKAEASASGWDMLLRYNNDSSSLYSITFLRGNGSSASSSRATGETAIKGYIGLSTTQPHLWSYDIFSYTGSSYKTNLLSVSADLNGSGNTQCLVGLYRSTSAITRLDVFPEVGSFSANTTATLYGILKA